MGEVGYLVHRDELVKLLGNLFEAHLVRFHNDGHARKGLVLGGGDGQRLDVEAATADHARDARQNAAFVLDENGEDMNHGYSLTCLDLQMERAVEPKPFR